jgi:hypothetical protein
MATESAPLFADQLRDGAARTGPWSSRRSRPLRAFGTADHSLSGEPLDDGGYRDTQQAGDRNSTLGDDHFLATSGSL